MTRNEVLRRLLWAVIERRSAGFLDDQPARLVMHPRSEDDILVDHDTMREEEVALVRATAVGGPLVTFRGIPIQTDHRVPEGEVRVEWT